MGEIKNIINFSHTESVQSEYANVINKLIKQDNEALEVIENVDLSYDNLCNFIHSLKQDALSPRFYLFTNWNPNVLIGTFCKDNYTECIYGQNNTITYFAFLSEELNNCIGERNDNRFYSIDLDNNYKLNELDMKETEKKRLTLRERVGRKLIENGYRLMGYNTQEINSSTPEDPWGEEVPKQIDEVKNVLTYFVKGVNDSSISHQKMGNRMSMSNVLDWLDSLTDEDVDGFNQVYVIRGIYTAKNKILYCAFLAKDDNFNLENNAKICFICDSETEEMKQLYNGKSIYIIPFED